MATSMDLLKSLVSLQEVKFSAEHRASSSLALFSNYLRDLNLPNLPSSAMPFQHKLRLKCLLILSTFLRPHSHCWYQTFSVIVLSPGARSFFHGYLLLLCSWPSLMSAPLGKLSPHSRRRKSPPPVLRMLFINNSTLTFAQLNSNYLPRHLSHWQDCELPSPRATTMDFKLAQCGHKVDV